jgi:membrane protein CcdC involved in cytochrome C biogenesis
MNPEVAAVIVGPKKRSFVRRHKLVLALAAIGALFAVLPKHRVAIAGILLCSALAVGCVIAVVLLANFSTQPDRLPTRFSRSWRASCSTRRVRQHNRNRHARCV